MKSDEFSTTKEQTDRLDAAVKALAEVCRENDLPYMAFICTSCEDKGEGNLYAMTGSCHIPAGDKVPDILRLCVAISQDRDLFDDAMQGVAAGAAVRSLSAKSPGLIDKLRSTLGKMTGGSAGNC